MVNTAQKMKFSIKDLSSQCGQIRSFVTFTWLHLLEKFLLENFIFSFCSVSNYLKDSFHLS